MQNPLDFRRHGDVNLYPITKEQFDTVQGNIISHDGSYILARGEATGSKHILSVKEPKNLLIKEDAQKRLYYAIKNEEATITHTHDHEIITTPKEVYYVQIPEREVNHFADSTIQQVKD